jgi:hypothetical protein
MVASMKWRLTGLPLGFVVAFSPFLWPFSGYRQEAVIRTRNQNIMSFGKSGAPRIAYCRVVKHHGKVVGGRELIQSGPCGSHRLLQEGLASRK